jgi:biopolymer transport protein ExbD
MAEITANGGGENKSHPKRRAKKTSAHIDMTPMVDLMSLLITFFMLTTAFSKPRIMEIVLPEDGDVGTNSKIECPAARTINLLLTGDNEIYYYVGKPPMNDEEVKASAGRLQKINYSSNGLRRLLLNKNLILYEQVDSLSRDFISGKSKVSKDSLMSLVKKSKKKDKAGPIVMIKSDKKAKYRNMVDVIDEMEICNIARYAIVEPNEYELKLLENRSF